MGSYIQNSLRDGERVKYEAHLSLWSLFTGFVFGVLLLGGSVVSVHYLQTQQTEMIGYLLSAFLFLAGSVMLVRNLATYYTTELAVTNKRLIFKRGWFSRSTVELLLHKVESVQVNQSGVQRLLNYGDIIISAAGDENATLTGISAPLTFKNYFNSANDELKEAIDTLDRQAQLSRESRAP